MSESMPAVITSVLSIDPGKTTGFVEAYVLDNKILVKPFQLETSCRDMWLLLHQHTSVHTICEDFEFRRHLVWAELYPMQLIGVVNLFCESFKNTQLTMQKAAAIQGRGAYFADKEKLKELGVYIPGREYHHAMDAMRHLCHWFMFGTGFVYYGHKPFELVKE